MSLLLSLFFIVLTTYSWFSYGLSAPNLTLINQPGFTRFQSWMSEAFYHNRPLTAWIFSGLIIALFLLYYLIINKIPTNQKNRTKHLLIWSLLIFPLSLSYNALSLDVFNYIFNARMVLKYSANPHIISATGFLSDPWTRFMHNVHTPAPYWYGWTALSLLPYLIGFNKFLLTWLGFRLFSILSLGLTYLALQLFSQNYQQRSLKIKEVALLFLNPLVLIEIISNSHNDLWMMAPAVSSIGLLLSQKKLNWQRIVLSLLLLLASISTKMASVALVPIWIWLLLRKKVNLKKGLKLLDQLVWNHLPTFASLVMFLPLLSTRSQQFHPWYLSWSLVWLPLMKKSAWKNSLLLFSLASLCRYIPWLLANDYNPSVSTVQMMITWLVPSLYLIISSSIQLVKKLSA